MRDVFDEAESELKIMPHYPTRLSDSVRHSIRTLTTPEEQFKDPED